MIRATGAAAAVLMTGGLLGLGALPAQAAQQPFTIRESIDFNTGVTTFTASGLGDCTSGTFVDTVRVSALLQGRADGVNLSIDTVYLCNTGGSIYATKQVHLRFSDDGSATNTGPFRITGGTGAYTSLSGAGMDVGLAGPDGIAAGTITGKVLA